MIEVNAEIVRELLDYNPEAGVFTWKVRDRNWFDSDKEWKRFHSRLAGKPAGTFDKTTGYRCIGIFRVQYKAHRLAWLYVYGEWPNDEIDHINQVTTDNRIENLREVTHSQNQWNRSIQSGTSSQYKGVHWDKRDNKWRANIRIDGKRKHLGLFTIEEDAARAYDLAALKYYGEYANLNFPIEDYLDYIEELAA